MDITRTRTADVTVVSLSGDIDLYSSADFKKTIADLIAEGTSKLAVDLTNVQYLDSSGVGVLLYAFTSLQKRNRFVVYCGATGDVYRVLELTKLIGFLPIVDTLEDAIARLAGVAVPEKPTEQRGLRVDPNNPLFQKKGMYYKEFHIDFTHIRRLANLISRKAPPEIRDINMLEQQISELIKNAVKHGNKNDKDKAVRIWFSFSAAHAHLIVEDEGEGFAEIERWNEFYRNKIECYQNQDYERMMNYLAFRTETSDDTDGGNALFAAVEYWNEGVVFNEARNAVAVCRRFGL